MGKVYLVGAGPGDPKLITLKGIEKLQECDVVIYDRLASFELLEYTKKDCIKVFVGKEAGHHSKKQEEINQIIIEYAKANENVVRLKGGDSFVFGRGGEEILCLIDNLIPYEVIPGITSAISVPEIAGIPVTHRGMSTSFHVITGHTQNKGDIQNLDNIQHSENSLTDNYDVLAKLKGTLVFLMGLSNISEIVSQLIENGMDKTTPAAVISNGTLKDEVTVRGCLKDIEEKVKECNLKSPAIIVIGETTKLNLKCDYESKETNDLSIGFIGTSSMFYKLKEAIKYLPVQLYSMCEMYIEKITNIIELEEELKRLDRYDWVVFTSQSTINIFFEEMDMLRIDRRNLQNIKFAVLGKGTADALIKYGYYADFIPSKYNSEDLAYEFSDIVKKDENILIPRALQGLDNLSKILAEKGVHFNEIPVYDVKGEISENISLLKKMDMLIFVSASGVKEFFQKIKENDIELPGSVEYACIGKATTDKLKEYIVSRVIMPEVSDTAGLTKLITSYQK